jgi:cholesterol transport system auxiliary component
MNQASIVVKSGFVRLGVAPACAGARGHPRACSFGRLCVVLCALLASACSLPLTGPGEVAAYDFGAAAGAREGGPRLRQPLLVYDVGGPAWMDSASIHYRLAYRDASRPQAYAGSRWVMPPAALLTNRLRQRLAGAGGGVILPTDGLRAPVALRVELDEFTQVFDAENRSRAVVRLRASLVGSRSLVAQKAFSVDKAAATQDAEGGVRALTAASDEVLEQLLSWIAASLKG